MKHSLLKKTVGLGTFAQLFIVRAGVFAQTYGLDETAGQAGLKPAGTPITPAALVGNIIGYALGFVGVIFFLIMVYGGFLWMTARGNGDSVKRAKEMIEQAAIGIVIVFVSYLVTNFVLKSLLPAVLQ